MSESAVAIVGSGIAATAVASVLAGKGHDVVLFEKGPPYPYPHAEQFQDRFARLSSNPAHQLPRDLKSLTTSGSYAHDIELERFMRVGGSATVWAAIALRMSPEDFKTRARFAFGQDWPIDYADVEPHYGRAEALLGVAGTDADHPFAPPRSTPFPLGPFELSWDDQLLADRLEADGVVLHTTPQARTRAAFDGRQACMNFGACDVCPIGARYSPNHHLQAMQSARVRIIPNAAVRSIAVDSSGRARSLIYRTPDAAGDQEHGAKVIVVAAGAIETARLLLLSKIGESAGQVGQGLVFHHLWDGALLFPQPLFPGRSGPVGGQSLQFKSPERRGEHGGIKVELSSDTVVPYPELSGLSSASEVIDRMKDFARLRPIVMHAESAPGPGKHVSLSKERDRFGDPFAHVHYDLDDFDQRTWSFAEQLAKRFARATGSELVRFDAAKDFDSGAHHMATCRMSAGPAEGAADGLGCVHGVPNLYLAGSAVFASSSGPVNPTLTLVALALRTADAISERLGPA